MTTPTKSPNLQDDRWDGYVPWFLRHPDIPILGRFDIFFDRVAHRLEQFILYEGGIPNNQHMGALIESESHRCFRFNKSLDLSIQIKVYFSPAQFTLEANNYTTNDTQVVELNRIFKEVRTELINQHQSVKTIMGNPAYVKAQNDVLAVTSQRDVYYQGVLAHARLTVLESVVRLVQTTPNFSKLRSDLRRYLAEAQIMLDVTASAKIVPMEEPILQKEVIDRLLPRLATRFPQQETDLVKAYHDLVQGVDANTVFGNAFKALEEVARQMTGDNTFELNKEKNLRTYFPLLHPTVYATIKKLADHRGDKAAHGRQGPPPHEMRYLLFSICNVALLFLDYPSPTNPASAS